VSGLWHGANWTFVVWGALHGFYLLVGTFTAPARNKLRVSLLSKLPDSLLATFQVLTTFGLVTLAWTFFRVSDVRDGFFIIAHMFDWHGFAFHDLLALGLPRFEVALTFVVIASVAIVEWFMNFKPRSVMQLWSLRSFRWSCCYANVFAIIFFGVFNQIEFIYFQF
jgi:alginate O-acetyltransferase complex protein AlgI